MIHLRTGQPGHGKTLRAITQALEYVKQGRVVYACGVKGLNYDAAGFLELKDPTRWFECPPGSVFLIDECYRWFPKRAGGSKVPPHVELLATHRHNGYDFIFISQSPMKQIDPFIHDLIEHHEHIRRKFGMKKAVVLWWDRFEPNVKTGSSTKKFWAYPKDVMARNLYVSTEMDTTEKRVPWYIWALPVTAVLGVLLFWRAQSFFHPQAEEPPKAGKGAGTPMVLGGTGVGGQAEKPKRPQNLKEFVKWQTPRVEGQVWTAPMFDDRPIVAEPRLFCVSVETGDCRCYTEQGTKYKVQLNICRAMVDGGVYDPTRKGLESTAQAVPPQPATDPQPQPQRQPEAPVGSGTPWPEATAAIHASYVPPELSKREPMYGSR